MEQGTAEKLLFRVQRRQKGRSHGHSGGEHADGVQTHTGIGICALLPICTPAARDALVSYYFLNVGNFMMRELHSEALISRGEVHICCRRNTHSSRWRGGGWEATRRQIWGLHGRL